MSECREYESFMLGVLAGMEEAGTATRVRRAGNRFTWTRPDGVHVEVGPNPHGGYRVTEYRNVYRDLGNGYSACGFEPIKSVYPDTVYELATFIKEGGQ